MSKLFRYMKKKTGNVSFFAKATYYFGAIARICEDTEVIRTSLKLSWSCGCGVKVAILNTCRYFTYMNKKTKVQACFLALPRAIYGACALLSRYINDLYLFGIVMKLGMLSRNTASQNVQKLKIYEEKDGKCVFFAKSTYYFGVIARICENTEVINTSLELSWN